MPDAVLGDDHALNPTLVTLARQFNVANSGAVALDGSNLKMRKLAAGLKAQPAGVSGCARGRAHSANIFNKRRSGCYCCWSVSLVAD